MDCPDCGTYNPESRTTCWRCGNELPQPKPQKKRDPQKRAQLWLYVAVVVFFVFTVMQTCGVKLPFGAQPSQQQEPSGYSLPTAPIACQVEMSWRI